MGRAKKLRYVAPKGLIMSKNVIDPQLPSLLALRG